MAPLFLRTTGSDVRSVRLPADVIVDSDLSDAAFRLYAVLVVKIAGAQPPVPPGVCLETNAELGRLSGQSPRNVTRLLGELESRGYVRVKPETGISGRPRGIRLL